MPFSGTDHYQPGDPTWMFDPVGQSPDISTYFGLSAGGRFPNDLSAYLEYLAARDPAPGRDPASPNPDFEFPTGLEDRQGLLAAFLRQLERDQREGGLGPISDPLGAGPAYFPWSGPGAGFGPEGGPLHGVLDQAGTALQDRDYHTNTVMPRDGGNGGGGRGGGGGGGGSFNFNFQPYQGLGFTPQFQGWAPIEPFAMGSPSAPGPSSLRGTVPASTGAPISPRQGGGGGGGQIVPPRGSGGGGGGRQPAAPRPPNAPAPVSPRGQGANIPRDLLDALRLLGDQNPDAPGPNPTHFLREGGNRGYDAGMLDRGSPGWTRDPTTGIRNTAGFPMPTIPGQLPGESQDAYITRLHDAGFDNESILGVLSGWGTGGVVRTPDGQLMFQNQYDQRLAQEEDANRRATENALSAIGGGGLGPLADLFSFGGGFSGMRY